MARNMGPLERGLRLVIGVLILGLFGALPSPERYLTLVGLPLVATALTGFCPLYRLLGIGARRQ
ncbi:MAG: DUF2892 domain-containing protein [Gemmatimonadales bacterium]|jgi:hypothetical protein